jgi:hypothetical protein
MKSDKELLVVFYIIVIALDWLLMEMLLFFRGSICLFLGYFACFNTHEF